MASILKVDTIKHKDGTTALEIDSTGRITEPAKPRVMVRGRNGAVAQNGSEYRINAWHETYYNTGFTVTDGKLIFPVDGFYNICFNASEFTSSNHPNAIAWHETSSATNIMYYQFEINDYDNKGISFSMPLEVKANDKFFVGFHNSYAGPTTSSSGKYKVYLSAYLIS